MLLHVANFFLVCIFATEISVADSNWGELIDLGKAATYQNSSEDKFSNCSEYNIAYGSSCTCFDCSGGRCTICCNSPGFSCCYCHACLTSCWKNDWQFISFAQIGISTAILVGTVASIALFFRICHGGFALVRRGRNGNGLNRGIPSRLSVSSVQQYIIERLQDRPPQYNNASDAPPTYDADPANCVATLEDPPKYTRKPLDTENDNIVHPPVSESSTASTATTTVSSATANHM